MTKTLLTQKELEEHIELSLIDMRENGMCFHEGYLIGTAVEKLKILIVDDIKGREGFTFLSAKLKSGEYLTDEEKVDYQDFPKALHVSYRSTIGNTAFLYQLLIDLSERDDRARYDVEITCDRNEILSASDPEAALRNSIDEFARLYEVTEAEALFLGPDTVQVPSLDENSDYGWIRMK